MRYIGLVLMSWLCASCVYFNPPFAGGDQYKNPTLLYGRFELTKGNDSYFRLGLAAHNIKTKEPAYFEFLSTNSLYAVLVDPGIYQIDGFVGINREHKIKHRFKLPEGHMAQRLGAPFRLNVNEAMYLGDFSGQVTYDGMILEWRIGSAFNHFTTSTEELFRNNPKLMKAVPKSIFDSRNKDL